MRLGNLGGLDPITQAYAQMLINAYQVMPGDNGVYYMDTEFAHVNGMSRQFAEAVAGLALSGISSAGLVDSWYQQAYNVPPLVITGPTATASDISEAQQNVAMAQGVLANGASQILSGNDGNSAEYLISAAQGAYPQLFASAPTATASNANTATSTASLPASAISLPVAGTPQPIATQTARSVVPIPTSAQVTVNTVPGPATTDNVGVPVAAPASNVNWPLVAAGAAALFLLMKKG